MGKKEEKKKKKSSQHCLRAMKSIGALVLLSSRNYKINFHSFSLFSRGNDHPSAKSSKLYNATMFYNEKKKKKELDIFYIPIQKLTSSRSIEDSEVHRFVGYLHGLN